VDILSCSILTKGAIVINSFLYKPCGLTKIIHSKYAFKQANSLTLLND